MAVKVYHRFLERTDEEPIRSLFGHLHADETRHVAYWSGLLERVRRNEIGELFEAPEKILFELGSVAEHALSLQRNTIRRTPRDTNSLLLSAVNMEYVLLHPSFLVLFDFADILPNHRTMEDEYMIHMDHLCSALNTQEGANPMFPLFGKLLRRVWRETKRLVTLNQSDMLSGVLNRRGFHMQIRPLFFLAERKGYPVAVMIVDVDKFKLVNDRYGHQAGDRVIKLVAEAVRINMRQSDIVARYGGDEFIVFLLDTRPEALEETAKKIKECAEKSSKAVAPVTVSIGIASLTPRGDIDRTIEHMIGEADQALYEVKEAGRDGYRLRVLEGEGRV
jgi:diguanylate cyclase (GGDEF)-like protein